MGTMTSIDANIDTLDYLTKTPISQGMKSLFADSCKIVAENKESKVEDEEESEESGEEDGEESESSEESGEDNERKELEKECSVCSDLLPLSSYSPQKNGLYGRTASCKDCANEARRKSNKAKDRKILVRVAEKECAKCKKILPAMDFNLDRNSPKTGLKAQCRPCEKDYRLPGIEWRKKKREEGECAKCGYKKDWRALDFAHLDRNTKARGSSGKVINMGNINSIKKLEEEWVKIKLLCKICHRLETKEEDDELCEERKDELLSATVEANIHKKKLGAKVNAEKLLRHSCLVCKLVVTPKNYCCFDFDHRKPKEKMASVSYMVGCKYSWEKIEAEMKVCNLLCAICHYLKSLDNNESGRGGHVEKKISAEELAERYKVYPLVKKRKFDKITGEPSERKYSNFVKSLTEENKKLLAQHKNDFGIIALNEFHRKCKLRGTMQNFYNYANTGVVNKYYGTL